MSRILRLLVWTLVAFALLHAQPVAALSPTGDHQGASSTQPRAGLCTGRTYRPGVVLAPYGGKFVAGTADQTCESNRPFTQQICVKIQGIYGGPNSTWFDLTEYNCNSNSGPSISGTQSISCSNASPIKRFRTAARGRVTPVDTRRRPATGTPPASTSAERSTIALGSGVVGTIMGSDEFSSLAVPPAAAL